MRVSLVSCNVMVPSKSVKKMTFGFPSSALGYDILVGLAEAEMTSAGLWMKLQIV